MHLTQMVLFRKGGILHGIQVGRLYRVAGEE